MFLSSEESISIDCEADDILILESRYKDDTLSQPYIIDKKNTQFYEIKKDGYFKKEICTYSNKSRNSILLNCFNLFCFIKSDYSSGSATKLAQNKFNIKLEKINSIDSSQSVYVNSITLQTALIDTAIIQKIDGYIYDIFKWEDIKYDTEEQENIIFGDSDFFENDIFKNSQILFNKHLRQLGVNIPKYNSTDIEIASSIYFLDAEIYDLSISIDNLFSFSMPYPVKYTLNSSIKWYLTNSFNDTIGIYLTSSASTFFHDFFVSGTPLISKKSEFIKKNCSDLLQNKEFTDIITNPPTKIIDIDYDSAINVIANKKVKNIKEAIKSVVTVSHEKGHGSGCYISNDGYILTNYHVISDCSNLKIIDYKGNTYPAEIIRVSEEYDAALIKAECKNEFAFSIEDSIIVNNNDTVYTIGSGIDIKLKNSISRGKIKEILIVGLRRYYVTNAMVNPGNSGGASANSNGQLTGLVTAKSIKNKNSRNDGYIVPIDICIKSLNINQTEL